MARDNTAILDGLVVGYGNRNSINRFNAEVHTLGRVKQQEIVVDFSNIVSFAAGSLAEGPKKDAIIPAGSAILSCVITVESDVQDLTSLAIGLKDTVDGTLVGADDTLVTDADAVEANLETDDKLVGTGSLTSAQDVVTASDATIAITVTGAAVDAGRFVVLTEYIEPQASQDSPAIIVGEI